MLSRRRSFVRLLALTAGSSLAAGRRTLAAGLRQSTNEAKQTASAPATAATVPALAMPAEAVLGIGGFFFRSHNPEALGKWYLQHLGIALSPTSFDQKPWRQQAGTTLFAPFPQDTKYFDSTRGWMINFRVRDLKKMAAQLEAAGIAVKIDTTVYKNNLFAHLQDPDGNPIELWQPGEEA